MLDIPKETIVKAAEGDMACFEEIYKVTSGFVFNVAYRVAHNTADAEDITQEVFMTIHRKLKEFRMEAQFKTWLYRVTVNSAINHVKKLSRERDRRNEVIDEYISSNGVMEPAAPAQDNGTREEINALLSMLNADQRACIVLRNIEGLSYDEIAKSLKINIGTVRSRLKRAREKLLEAKKGVMQHELR